jgi:hypothetical protein
MERIVPGTRALFAARWLWTRLRTWWYLARLKPGTFQGKFGVEPPKR